MVILATVAAIIICVTSGIYTLRSRASSTDDEIDCKYYKNIMIAYDYNLSDAAAEYADEHYDDERAYLREVCRINHLASASDVTPGTHVIVPYYSEERP